MKLDLNPRQIKVLDLILSVDLEAFGLNTAQQRAAHSIHLLIHEAPKEAGDPAKYEPLRVLRLTQSYRHSDK